MVVSDSMTVTRRELGPALVVSVAGEIDVLTAPKLREALETSCTAQASAGQRRKPVVVDLTEVRFLSSNGVAVLAEINEFAGQRSVVLQVVTGESRLVVRPLQITGLDAVLALYPDLDAALDAGSSPVTRTDHGSSVG